MCVESKFNAHDRNRKNKFFRDMYKNMNSE